jgi:hypothetical protein
MTAEVIADASCVNAAACLSRCLERPPPAQALRAEKVARIVREVGVEPQTAAGATARGAAAVAISLPFCGQAVWRTGGECG